MSEILLSRYADAIFWNARYVERAENLARILDVTDTFTRDATGAQNWLSIVQLHSDEERFFARTKKVTPELVRWFYLLDSTNPTSVVSAVRSARDNARALRPLISTEMWMQMNVFHNWIASLDGDDLAPGRLNEICRRIKEACQMYTGITEGTFYRDQSWYFYEIGRYLERADQTTRLLDMKYHLLLPQPTDVGSPIDVRQWNALLRSAAAYHAYRKLHPRGMTPGQVAGFLLLNRQFPRSVYLCAHQIELLLAELKARYGLRGGNGAAEQLDSVRALLGDMTITQILAQGLHELLDLIQVRLNAVTRDLAISFFGWLEEAA